MSIAVTFEILTGRIKMETTMIRPVLVDLRNVTEMPTRVFAGRDWGAEVRKQQKLDEYDQDPSVIVTVHVPADTFSVNSSFFLAMFGNSIRTLGADEFRRKYVFTGKDITEMIEDSIVDALSGPTGLF